MPADGSTPSTTSTTTDVCGVDDMCAVDSITIERDKDEKILSPDSPEAGPPPVPAAAPVHVVPVVQTVAPVPPPVSLLNMVTKSILLFAANFLAYFISKGISDWTGTVCVFEINKNIVQMHIRRVLLLTCVIGHHLYIYTNLTLFVLTATTTALYLMEYMQYKEGPRMQVMEIVLWSEVSILCVPCAVYYVIAPPPQL